MPCVNTTLAGFDETMPVKAYIHIFLVMLAFLLSSCRKEKAPSHNAPSKTNFTLHSSANNPAFLSDAVNHIEYNPTDNSVWIGTDSGIVIFTSNNQWKVLNSTNSGLTSNKIHTITFGSSNTYIGSDNGLFKFDGATWTGYNTSNSALPLNRIRSLSLAPDNSLWIGTYGGGGLAKYDGTGFTAYTPANSGLPNNSVGAVYVDANNVVWAGTGGGLTRFDGASWTVYNSSNSGLPNNLVYCIKPEGSNMLISTNGGLAVFDGLSNWTVYDSQNSGIHFDFVRAVSVISTAQHVKYIATDGGGLVKNDNGVWSTYDLSNSNLPTGYVTALAHDPVTKRLWVGTTSGVAILQLN